MKKKLTLLVALSIIIGYIFLPIPALIITGGDIVQAEVVEEPNEAVEVIGEEVLQKEEENLTSTLLPIEQIAVEINAGLWGYGTERKERLEAAGYNYEEVQNKVNEMYPRTERIEEDKVVVTTTSYSGIKLNRTNGTIQGPSGKETYYNLPMGGVIQIMSAFGYSQSDYWVREDGCKMLGQYIMVAAHLGIRPRGSLVETSLGTGIVCDTGGFALNNPTQLDIATVW